MRVLIALALTALSGCVVVVPGSSPLFGGGGALGADAVQADPVNDASFATQLNTYRVSTGAGTVIFDQRLSDAAQAHADDMVDRGYFEHVSPEGNDVYDRMVAAGYTPNAWGENIAGRQSTEAEVLLDWINSPDHDEILKAGSFEDFGLGLSVGDESRWVLVMGREAP